MSLAMTPKMLVPNFFLKLEKNKPTRFRKTKLSKIGFFRVLVVQFVNKRVKTHNAKTKTKSCNNEILIFIIYEA